MDSMKRGLLSLVLMVGGLIGLMPNSNLAQAQSVEGMAQAQTIEDATAGNFRWSGECQIRCSDGRCQSYCSTGVVFAFDAFDAKLKAEAELRARAGSQGSVVEGSIRVTITLFQLDKQATIVEAERSDRSGNASPMSLAMADVRRYSWSGYAILRKNGAEIRVDDGGVLLAESLQHATAYAGNSIRYGAKVKSYEAQGWDCRASHATATGPLP